MTGDELLARIDERTLNICRDIGAIKTHLEKQNDQLSETRTIAELAEQKADAACGQAEQTDSKFNKLLIGTILTMLPIVFALVTKITGVW